MLIITMTNSESTPSRSDSQYHEEQQDDYPGDVGEPQWPVYDRSATNRAVSRLYEALQHMYLPSGSLEYPFTDSWKWSDSFWHLNPVVELMGH